MASVRGVLAAIVVFLFLWLRGALGGIDRKVMLGAMVLGILAGALPNTLIPVALQRMEAAPAALVQAAGPLIITLLAGVLLPGEKPTPRMLVGVGIGFFGIALLAGVGGLGGSTMVGALLILAATCSYAVSTIWVRMAPRSSADSTT